MPKGKLYLQRFAKAEMVSEFIGFQAFNRKGRVFIEAVRYGKKVATQIDFTYVEDTKPMLMTSAFPQDFMMPTCYFPSFDEDLQFKFLHQLSFERAAKLLPKNQVGYYEEGLPSVFNQPLLQLFIDDQGYCHLTKVTKATPPPPQIIEEDEEEEFGI